MIKNILGGLFGKVVEHAEGILDEIITTDEERDRAKLAIKKIMLDAEREAFNKEVEDRKDARSLYKDDAIIQKMVDGRINKFFQESCLMEQTYIKDPDKKVADLLNETISSLGENISINQYTRFAIGESLSSK